MKIAILISGYLRSFKNNIEHFFNNVIQNNEVDIYIHKSYNEQNDKYSNVNEWEYIKKKLNPKIILETKDVLFTENLILNNVLNQFYKFFILNNIKNRCIENEQLTYDIVIKWRPDILINEKINFTDMLKNTIYIPKDAKMDITKLQNTNDKYLCDIIAYGDNISMDYYFNFYEDIYELIKKYGVCQETLLYYYLQNVNYCNISINYAIILSTCNIISISGNSGSGKSTLSNFLNVDISNSFILECDRYHKWERGNKNWDKFTHLNPKANYLTKMENDVFDLKIGKNIFQVNYNHKNGKFTSEKLIESKDTVIVCGLHTTYNKHSNIYIFMDTMEDLNKIWKIKRDIKKRSYSVENVLKNIEERQKDYETYILPQKYKSDIIVNFFTDDKINFDDFDIIYDIKLNLFIKKKYNILKLIYNIPIKIEQCHNVDKLQNYYKLIIINNNTINNKLVFYYDIINQIIKNLES